MSGNLEELKSNLLTVDFVREELSSTDNMGELEFTADGMVPVEFDLPDDWQVNFDKSTDRMTLTDATVNIGGVEVKLTLGAALDATSKMRMPKDYALHTPGSLVTDHLNHHYSHEGVKGRTLKLLYSKDVGYAFTSGQLTPFNGVRLLDEAISAVEEVHKVDESAIYADAKFHHDIGSTQVRLVVPEKTRKIASARAGGSEDLWSTGVVFEHSVSGLRPLSAGGYTFAWWCQNGASTVHGESVHRRKPGEEQDDVYAWFQKVAGESLAGMSNKLDEIESATKMTFTVAGEELSETLQSVFDTYKVPKSARQLVTDNLVNNDDLSAYGLMQALTGAANDLSDEDWIAIQKLLTIGGEVVHALAGRCPECHKI